MYGYIYKTTCLINNKIYVGQKKSKKFLGQKYLGSGKLLKQAIKKYGRENFKVILLEECETFEKLNEREIHWIATLSAQDHSIGYNIAAGGVCGVNPWLELTVEEHKKLVEQIKTTRIDNGNFYHTEEEKQKISASLCGHEVSEETRKKLRDKKLDFYQSDAGQQIKKQLSESKNNSIPWNKGLKMSEDYCQKIKDSHPTGYTTHTEKTKQAISKSLKQKFISGELIQHEGVGKKKCKNLDTGEVFESLSAAATAYGISNGNSIVKCSAGKIKTCGGLSLSCILDLEVIKSACFYLLN